MTPTNPSVRVTLPVSLTQPVVPAQITPSTTAPTSISAQEEIFSDSFDSATGWTEESTERYSAGRSEGGLYQMSFWIAGDQDYQFLIQPHHFSLPLRNMNLRTQGTALNGNGAYGLVCRWSDSINLYTFHISTDGRYWLYKRVNGTWTNLGSGTSSVIQEENAIELQCVNDRISASVNNMVIAAVTDRSLSEGNGGLFAQPLGGSLEGAWSYYAVFQSFDMTVLP